MLVSEGVGSVGEGDALQVWQQLCGEMTEEKHGGRGREREQPEGSSGHVHSREPPGSGPGGEKPSSALSCS